MTIDSRTHLTALGFRPRGGPESPAAVADLERRIDVPLPAGYRNFLLEVGGGHLDAVVPCTVLTPFGRHTVTELHGVKEVAELLDSAITPRNLVGIGAGHNAATTCLSIAGLDHGQVFALDAKMRFYWDADTPARFPHLDPEIREFFRLRDAGELPERPWGYENCYHIADSFDGFVGKLLPAGAPPAG